MAYQIANHQTLIDQFVSGLPNSVWSSPGRVRKPMGFELFDAPWYRDRDEALKFPLVQPQRRRVQWIVIDLDCPDAVEKARSFHVKPNMIVENPGNGHAHVFWLLAEPVTLPREKKAKITNWVPKPIFLLQRVRRALTLELGGDKAFAAALVKNPLCPRWTVHTLRAEPYTLSDMSKHLDMKAAHKDLRSTRTASRELDPTQRNCSTFNALRFWALTNKWRFADENALGLECLEEARRMNATFARPMSDAEVSDIARSVGGSVWDYQGPISGQSYRRGAARVDASLEPTERQRLGARYTAGVRAEGTWTKLRAAIARLVEVGMKVSQKTLAEAAGVGVATVKRHWKSLMGGGKFTAEMTDRVRAGVETARAVVQNVKVEVVKVVKTAAQVVAQVVAPKPRPEKTEREPIARRIDEKDPSIHHVVLGGFAFTVPSWMDDGKVWAMYGKKQSEKAVMIATAYRHNQAEKLHRPERDVRALADWIKEKLNRAGNAR